MPTTVGQVQLRLNKLPHGAGVDRVVLLGIINDVYQRYLNSYQWQRLVKTSTLQTTAIYDTGTLAVSAGGTTLTGTDTVWTAAMTGRRIRIAGRNETYIFTRVSNTSATIDRAFEGDAETEAAYYIFQSIYAAPVDADLIDSIEVPGSGRDLDQESAEYLDKLGTDRWTLGRPTLYTPAPDVTISSVVYPAVELYPIPDTSEGLIVRYRQTVSLFTSTGDSFLPWIHIECIVAGCEARLYRLKGDLSGTQMAILEYNTLLDEAKKQDSDRQYPDEMMMDERYTWHRSARALGHDRFSRHWWQLRNSN